MLEYAAYSLLVGVKKKGKKKKLTARGGRLARMKHEERRAETARQDGDDDPSES